jgi:hypothetical protein
VPAWGVIYVHLKLPNLSVVTSVLWLEELF